MTVLAVAVTRLAGARATSPTHPGYKLSELDRDHLAILKACGLWTDTALAKAFGVDRAVVRRIERSRSVA